MGKKWKWANKIPLEKQEKPYQSITYGPQTEEDMLNIIKQRIQSSFRDFTVYVGTDSQTHSRTKIVSVVAILEHGKGGFWFHTIDWLRQYKKEEIRTKIYDETVRSIDLAKRIVKFFYENGIDVPVVIHADIGKGRFSKTKEMIDEVVGMINAYGFEAEIKPESFAACSVADRISK